MKKREWEILIDFYLIGKNNMILSELAENLNISPTDPYFRNVLKILESNEIVNFKESEHGNFKLVVDINLKRLRKVIEECEYWKRIYNYLDRTRGVIAF